MKEIIRAGKNNSLSMYAYPIQCVARLCQVIGKWEVISAEKCKNMYNKRRDTLKNTQHQHNAFCRYDILFWLFYTKDCF